MARVQYMLDQQNNPNYPGAQKQFQNLQQQVQELTHDINEGGFELQGHLRELDAIVIQQQQLLQAIPALTATIQATGEGRGNFEGKVMTWCEEVEGRIISLEKNTMGHSAVAKRNG